MDVPAQQTAVAVQRGQGGAARRDAEAGGRREIGREQGSAGGKWAWGRCARLHILTYTYTGVLSPEPTAHRVRICKPTQRTHA